MKTPSMVLLSVTARVALVFASRAGECGCLDGEIATKSPVSLIM